MGVSTPWVPGFAALWGQTQLRATGLCGSLHYWLFQIRQSLPPRVAPLGQAASLPLVSMS